MWGTQRKTATLPLLLANFINTWQVILPFFRFVRTNGLALKTFELGRPQQELTAWPSSVLASLQRTWTSQRNKITGHLSFHASKRTASEIVCRRIMRTIRRERNRQNACYYDSDMASSLLICVLTIHFMFPKILGFNWPSLLLRFLRWFRRNDATSSHINELFEMKQILHFSWIWIKRWNQ